MRLGTWHRHSSLQIWDVAEIFGAGLQVPSDHFAGLELGRRVASRVIEIAKADGSDAVWTGTVPTGKCM